MNVAEGRRAQRERALGLLYEAETKGIGPEELLDELPVRPDEFTMRLVRGVGLRRDELDRLIASHARGWPTDRMPVVDLVALRLGTYELLEELEVPIAVVLSEAVELVKRYSTGDSGRFVNGVLATLAEELRPTV